MQRHTIADKQSAIALRHRYPGGCSLQVCRLSSGCRTAVLADPARRARPDTETALIRAFHPLLANPYFIDLDHPGRTGLAGAGEIDACQLGVFGQTRIDYSLQYQNRYPLLASGCQPPGYGSADFLAFPCAEIRTGWMTMPCSWPSRSATRCHRCRNWPAAPHRDGKRCGIQGEPG